MTDFDPSKPCRTESHIPVKILYHDDGVVLARVSEMYPISILYQPNGVPMQVDMRGRYDLINTPETHEVVVYFKRRKSGGDIAIAEWASVTNNAWECIGSKRITFTEGEFED